MPEISPLGNPSIYDIERAGERRLARSNNDKQAHTDDARLVLFLNFVEYHSRSHNYLTNDVELLLFTYTTWLLCGNTLLVKDKPGDFYYIRVNTIKGYLREINKHYVLNDKPPPFDTRIKSRTVRLLEDQAKYEKECARRAPLADETIMRMFELAVDENDAHGFRSLMWHITNIGIQSGLQRQECAMESADKIQQYLMPNGQLVM